MWFRKKRVVLLRLAFLPMVFLALFARPSWPQASVTAFAVEVGGYIVLLAGLGLRIWSILYVGGRKSQELVTEGPYSICRNPLYLGTVLLACGVGLCFENPLMLIAAVAIVVPAHAIVVGMEERHLAQKFPGEYDAYRQKVPRFWPRLRNYRGGGNVVVPVRAIRRVAVDTLGVLLIPAIEDLLEVLHNFGLIPVLWRFP